jgi:coenzyme F420-0:L-glutamate ligase/coenzyme F420-1:gamma-L-glutamate ligase
MTTLQLIAIPDIPLIEPGADLGQIIVETLNHHQMPLQAGDILLLAQKIVSKAENRFVDLRTVTPSAQALELAAITGKDPREIEVILWDTDEIIRTRPGLLIVAHRRGHISANAGLDHSNVAVNDEEIVLRLPADSDASAVRLRDRLAELIGLRPPVLIIDSHNRPWRNGVTGVTIGLSGLKPVQDLRGRPDLFNRILRVTEVNVADQLAGAAGLLMGQADEGQPVIIARGLAYEADETAIAGDILRPKERDLFR